MAPAETEFGDRMSLGIPLDSAHIATARLFAGGVARSLELAEEEAEVLRLTLTEVCSEAVERRREGRILIDVWPEPDQIRVKVEANGPPNEQSLGDPIEASFRRTLIEALAPDVTFVEEKNRSSASFSL